MRTTGFRQRIIAFIVMALLSPLAAQDDDDAPAPKPDGELQENMKLAAPGADLTQREGGKSEDGEGIDAETKTAIGEKIVKAIAGDPDTLKKILESYLLDPDAAGTLFSENGWKFFKNLNLEFKALRPNTTSAETTLGIGYSIDKSIVGWDPFDCDNATTGLDLDFSSSGTIAFDRNVNPEDFLDTKLKLDFFFSKGGTRKKDESWQARFNALNDQLADIETQKELDESPLKREYLRLARDSLTDQFYFDASLDFGLESNQSFTNKQFALGGTVGVDLKGWGGKSVVEKLNFVDYPFALVRALTGYDSDAGGSDSIAVLGSTFPTFMIGVHYVDPQDMDARGMAGDTSGFGRFKAEAGFKTPIARVAEQKVFA